MTDANAKKRDEWIKIQDDLCARRIHHDALDFSIPTTESPKKEEEETEWAGLTHIAGLDISFVEGTLKAVGCLSVLTFPDLKVRPRARRGYFIGSVRVS
ncbi:hypothetical protein HDU67_008878 [Dinochytrium kinnereticum]|nr:hypothetical protein HDU67_008878 [Dinochytrium kinnereticum]